PFRQANRHDPHRQRNRTPFLQKAPRKIQVRLRGESHTFTIGPRLPVLSIFATRAAKPSYEPCAPESGSAGRGECVASAEWRYGDLVMREQAVPAFGFRAEGLVGYELFVPDRLWRFGKC